MTEVALFGKIPQRGDFVRLEVRGGEALDFASWLESAVDTARRGNVKSPEQPTRFLYRREGSKLAFLGVLKASADQVGRQFPIALFTTIDMAHAAQSYAALIQAFHPFFAEVDTFLTGIAKLDYGQIEAKVKAFARPTPQDLAAAEGEARSLLTQKAAPHDQAIFGPPSEGRHYFAYRTLAQACQQAKAGGSSKPGIVLDCPSRSSAHQSAWLSMVGAMIGPLPLPPCVFWQEPDAQGAARMLVAFGEPPPAALVFLSKTEHQNPKFWPLYCANPKALEATKAALTPAQRSAIDNPESSLFDNLKPFQ